jgi:hypothetical protein
MKAAKTQPVYNNMDEKHNEMLEKFRQNETVAIPELEDQIVELKSRIKTLQPHEIDVYMDIRDEIREKKREIRSLKQQYKKYLLDNSKYIFQYFEQKKNISSGQSSQNTNALNQFFKIKGSTPETSNPQSAAYNQSRNAYHQYWKNVNNHIINIQDFVVPSDICMYCQMGELIPQDEEGVLVCNNTKCGRYVPYIVDASKPVNKEPPNEVSYTAYIRLNHFKEILSQFQAKETTQIPDEVFSAIKARIKKERIEVSDITYDKMREILKKLELNKYFEHIQYINSMFGIKPPIMNEELHETLCILFIEIQRPWAKHCPAHRTNFFNYTYTLYQLCVLLDQTQYLPYIPMMKDREKQLEQDMIWKKVCQELDWEFFPTV